jgi:hypothetical protein
MGDKAFGRRTGAVSVPEDKRRERERAQPSRDAFAWTLPDYQALGGPGRTKIYELAKLGQLKLVTVAGRTMVDGESGRALLRGEPWTPHVKESRR